MPLVHVPGSEREASESQRRARKIKPQYAEGRLVKVAYANRANDYLKELYPKLGFDESLGQASPGQLILEDVLLDCCERGLSEFDFLGPNMPWKQEWSEQTRVHHWCFVFRDSLRGRALHAAKFKLAPTLKETWPWKH